MPGGADHSYAPLHQLLPLPQLLPAGARGFAVVDLETTGTGRLCRLVEIALLLLSPDGESEQEWSTVAPTLAALLEGRVLVAHNLDRGCLPGQISGLILRHHFREASLAWPGLSWCWIWAMASTRWFRRDGLARWLPPSAGGRALNVASHRRRKAVRPDGCDSSSIPLNNCRAWRR